ncbi:hypothetical protein [Yersinia frederiksenii]|uniref:hypothetical protein n=1 Tax=Yersinia frederiksenii TaxID=29484 RepID=UPI00070CD2A6|nr:hypothetical protein [Yersinia frederiksenii]
MKEQYKLLKKGSDRMELIPSVILLVSALWVMKDAHNNQLNHPVRWGIGTAILWIIVLPIYLIKRKKLITEQKMRNGAISSLNDRSTIWGTEKDSTNLWAGGAFIFIAAFAPYAWGVWNGALPKCDSSDVDKVLTQLLPNTVFSNPAQYDYERINEVRHCNLTIDNGIHSFTVKWYSDTREEFVVKFE